MYGGQVHALDSLLSLFKDGDRVSFVVWGLSAM